MIVASLETLVSESKALTTHMHPGNNAIDKAHDAEIDLMYQSSPV